MSVPLYLVQLVYFSFSTCTICNFCCCELLSVKTKQKMFTECSIEASKLGGQKPLLSCLKSDPLEKKHQESHQILLSSRNYFRIEGKLRDYFWTFGIKKWIYLHSCLSTWLQQRSTKLTCIRCLYADCQLELEGKCTLPHEQHYRTDKLFYYFYCLC